MPTDTTFTLAIPQTVESEEVYLGAILIDQEHYYSAVMDKDDFYLDRNKWIYESVQRIKQAGGNVDMMTVSNDLERRGLLAEIGGAAHLSALISRASEIWMLNPSDYAATIKEMRVRRDMISAANTIASLAYDTEKELPDAIEKSHLALQESTPHNHGVRSIGDVAKAIYNHVDKWANTKELPGIQTGLPSLDYILNGGYQDDSLNIIAARPGKGKSGLLVTNAIAADAGGKWVLFHSLEMSDEEMGQRLIGQKFGIDTKRMQTGKLLEHEWPLLTAGVEWLENSHIVIDETPAVSPAYIEAQARHYKARGKCDLVIADYLQLMTGQGDTRAQEVGYCSRYLKRIAKSLHVPVTAAAQLNREIERRSNKRPVLADLKESGDIEQDANTVTFIWSESEEEVRNVAINPRMLSVEKHRGGSTGDVKAQIIMMNTKFQERL